MTREEAIKIIRKMLACTDLSVRANLTVDMVDACHVAIKALEQEPCEDCVSRQFMYELGATCIATRNKKTGHLMALGTIEELPSVTPQEPQSFKWCTDCKEYDQEKHCCHRYSKVIRDTVTEIRQEPVLDKISKMKSEIADSLEFWDYSPNNNPLARDMLETITNFWGDIKAESEEE